METKLQWLNYKILINIDDVIPTGKSIDVYVHWDNNITITKLRDVVGVL